MRVWWSSRNRFITVSHLGGCGGIVKIDFNSLYFGDVVVLKELIFNSFQFGMVWWFYKTDFNSFYFGTVWWS